MKEWKAVWDDTDASPEGWVETTEGMYNHMLDVLPPRAMSMGAFLVGEPLRDTPEGEPVYACFRRAAGRYFARNLTLKQFQAFFTHLI